MDMWSHWWTVCTVQPSMDFQAFFVTVKTSLVIGRVVATIIPQYESEELLTEGLCLLKKWNSNWSPHFSMTDKSSVELNANGNVHPSCIRLLCDFHRAQAWERWVNKTANSVLPQDRDTLLSYLKDLAYATTGTFYKCHITVSVIQTLQLFPTESKFQLILEIIQKQPWYVNNPNLSSYLESEKGSKMLVMMDLDQDLFPFNSKLWCFFLFRLITYSI